MVEEQLVPRGIKDPKVLDAFRTVPRECFVTEEHVSEAYDDNPLPTILGQTISQPYMMALMTELLELPHDSAAKVLEIGTGSGYQAAILAHMGHSVVTVERLDKVADFAAKNLSPFTYLDRIKICVGDGCLGWPDDAPYDGVIVTAASPKIPDPLVQQTKIGGKIVIPVGNLFIQQLLKAVKVSEIQLEITQSTGCRFVPLIGKDAFSGEE